MLVKQDKDHESQFPHERSQKNNGILIEKKSKGLVFVLFVLGIELVHLF